jgi:YD repeat-containing protein
MEDPLAHCERRRDGMSPSERTISVFRITRDGLDRLGRKPTAFEHGDIRISDGRTREHHHPLGNETTYELDDDGRMVEMVEPRGNDGVNDPRTTPGSRSTRLATA